MDKLKTISVLIVGMLIIGMLANSVSAVFIGGAVCKEYNKCCATYGIIELCVGGGNNCEMQDTKYNVKFCVSGVCSGNMRNYNCPPMKGDCGFGWGPAGACNSFTTIYWNG